MEYYIEKPEDLVDILGKDIQQNNTSGNCYRITQSLDFSQITDFAPLGSGSNYGFDGELDGKGHVIKNLKIAPRQAYDLGFFAKIGKGVVKNLGFESVSVIQNLTTDERGIKTTRAGIIAAVCQGKISACGARGSVLVQTGTDTCQVGGLCGSLPYITSEISCSWADVSISFQEIEERDEEKSKAGNDKGYLSGGIAGSANGIITSCHSRSEIFGPQDKIEVYAAGGICGEADLCAKITSCYNIGYLHSRGVKTDMLGGIAGKAADSAGFANCFYLKGCLLSKNFQKVEAGTDNTGTAKSWIDLTASGFAQTELGADYKDTKPDGYLYTPSLKVFNPEGTDTCDDGYLKALCTPAAVSFTQSVYPDTTNPVKIACNLSDCTLVQVSITAVKRDQSKDVLTPSISGHSFSRNLGNNKYISYDFILTLKDKHDRIINVSDVDVEMKD